MAQHVTYYKAGMKSILFLWLSITEEKVQGLWIMLSDKVTQTPCDLTSLDGTWMASFVFTDPDMLSKSFVWVR